MIHSFLLIGQSNMAGRGFLNEAPRIDSSRIKTLRNGRWQPMYRPVNADRSFAGSNLAERFAELYAQKHGVDVGLIACADGGTSLEQWKPGGLLYDHAVCQARLASRTSTIAGVLWHQGEADCTPKYFTTYRERLTHMLTSLRRDLALDDVPVLLGGLGDFLAHLESVPEIQRHHPRVNEALQETAAVLPMTGFVSAAGLGSNPDHLHFNAAALYEFGQRYFDVFETLRDPSKVFVEKPCEDDALRTEMEAL